MIEEAVAVERIDEIAATPGIDVLFIGTSDLSFFPQGCGAGRRSPRWKKRLPKSVAAGKRHGKVPRPAGALSPQEVEEFRGRDFPVLPNPVTELGLIRLGAEALLKPLGYRNSA